MTEQINVNTYLDPRNQALYNEVISTYNVELLKILHPHENQDLSVWRLNYQVDSVKISFYRDTPHNGFFTHELLHAKLLANGFTDTSIFLLDEALIKRDTKTELLFTPIIGHIQNTFAHAKMIDEFLSLKFTPIEFISDFSSIPKIEELIEQIDEKFNMEGLPNDGISLFITSFYSIKDNINPKNDDLFKKLEQYLISVDKELYEILNENWMKWKIQTDYNNKPFIEKLLDEITTWYKSKKSA